MIMEGTASRAASTKMEDREEIRDLLQFKHDFTLGLVSENGSSKTNGSIDGKMGAAEKRNDESIKSLKEFQKSFKLGKSEQSNSVLSPHVNGSDCSQREVPRSLDITAQPVSRGQANTSKKKKQKKKRLKPIPDDIDYSFNDLYELTSEILGSGARATVITCIKRTTRQQYAAKIINNSGPEVRDRVLKEVEILYSCSSCDNFLKIEDFFETSEKFYLVFEKMEGPLLELIQKRERFTEREASEVTREVAAALSFLHRQGIAHRDLKPENILCQTKDEVVPIKVCDFDLSSMMSQHTPATTPNLFTPVGSAEYMAPEVLDTFTGEIFSYDKKCDLWSLGVLVYMMLSGSPPFTGGCRTDCGWEKGEECEKCQAILLEKIGKGQYSFPQEIWASISSEAKDLISSLLQRDVRKRLSADEVLAHPWIKTEVPDTPLKTPGVLRLNPSITDELSQVAASCLKCNRRLSTHFEKSFKLSPPGSSELALRRGGDHKFP
ncbi:PREDICTED: MAP kinase-interacting serine/threonine-protein kinase 1-like [Amphimedon queenslandica]|uniref:Protein kinase domain-containing protein n=1 Tax=Amphimedon queenslandica TaxID=400682 RepID=A0A1X7UGG7_AMPQE|nr:PREDICTED: MAP kinase-interacting serine/threonine-protein kinase 1-like [Amphimedon queenslandica]|eukprot:XP_003388109.1 PREDICTED: MAP kinase-interacting serine/threonine-protein kinase 1-like [Amphimedon queenslandica]